MNLFKDFVEGVASDIVSAVSGRLSVNSASNMVAACCQQNGWPFERPDATTMWLNFSDPIAKTRKLLVSVEDQGAIVGFSAFSMVMIPAEQVPTAVLAYLLRQNMGRFVAWRMGVSEDDTVTFALNYRALAPGLDHSVFKTICETMLVEVREFDVKMNKAGLLQ